MKNVFVILNPAADRGGAASVAERLARAFTRADVPFELHQTSQEGDAIHLAQQARTAGYEVVVAAGGDGTVNEVVNGLARAAGAGEPVGRLAILPIGSANDFSTMAGSPHKLDQIAGAIRAGRFRRVDLCHAQIKTPDGQISRYFNNSIGVGFEARVTVESREIERLRGFIIYLAAVFKAIRKFEHSHMTISWTDEARQTHKVAQPSLLVSLGNSRRSGGGFYITPDAVLDDGLLDLCIADDISIPQVLGLLPLTLFGAHRNHPAVRLTRCSSLSLTSDRPLPVHTDGEVISVELLSLFVSIEPGRLEVIV